MTCSDLCRSRASLNGKFHEAPINGLILTVNSALSAVESLLSPFTHRYPEACHKARHAVAHTSKLLQAMDDMTVPLTLVSFDASLSLTRDFSAGIIFQVVVVMGDHRKLNCVAVGGRWDRLVEQHNHAAEPPHRSRRNRRVGPDRDKYVCRCML
jgi:histidyl-tRNA synthetase